MVNEKDAIEIIFYAEENEIAIWLDGGWGVDALLGEETRVHNDIDLFVEKSNSKKFLEIIKEKGFSEVIEAYTTTDHTVWKDAKGRIIDLHILNSMNRDTLFLKEKLILQKCLVVSGK